MGIRLNAASISKATKRCEESRMRSETQGAREHDQRQLQPAVCDHGEDREAGERRATLHVAKCRRIQMP